MNLATQLLQNVKEAKQAEDEMSIPTYDDLKTPNNHVGSTSNATKERKVTGLGDRVEKKPTADVGTPHNEKGRKMSEATNPIMQALQARKNADGTLHITSPDGSAAMIVPLNAGINKAINGFVTSPDARADTTAAADKLFKLLGKQVPGVKAVRPEKGTQAQSQQRGPYNQYSGDASDIDTSGMSMASMESKGHKAADGEMTKPAIKSATPAKTARVRGKQNDEPKNKGNPGSSKEEKGQTKQQFTATPKDYKGGENEHKSMKKMHENVRQLEALLGRRLTSVREAYENPDFQQQKNPRTLTRLISYLDKILAPAGNGEKAFADGNPRLVVNGDDVILDLTYGPNDADMNAAEHPIARKLQQAGWRVENGRDSGTILISAG
jgi:hypothetical protein